ncbi:MAG: lysophospholipid acyltransferase family protein [Pseudobdellovibrionaceae bacterium]
MIFIRQILFNIAFYGFTALSCIVLSPLILLPRPQFIYFLNGYFKTVYLIEKYVLGLDFEVRGREHVPEGGCFLVAAKHYSAYETMKLHLLFNDPAIILKKELKYIPLWGWLAARAHMIFIDRSSRDLAVNSIVNGALRVKKEGRPIVIFPQGTRVSLSDTPKEKAYKGGVIRMYEAAQIPIIPLAMNSGLFWGRNAFFKYPGKVIFEFLPPIPPGQNGQDVLKQLSTSLEDASQRLVAEGKGVPE